MGRVKTAINKLQFLTGIVGKKQIPNKQGKEREELRPKGVNKWGNLVSPGDAKGEASFQF